MSKRQKARLLGLVSQISNAAGRPAYLRLLTGSATLRCKFSGSVSPSVATE